MLSGMMVYLAAEHPMLSVAEARRGVVGVVEKLV